MPSHFPTDWFVPDGLVGSIPDDWVGICVLAFRLCFDLSGLRSRRNGQHFPDDFTMFRPKCVYFWHIFGVFMTIYVQMSILMSNRGGFLEVLRVLQTVGPQIRAVGPRKWSGCWNFSIIPVI